MQGKLGGCEFCKIAGSSEFIVYESSNVTAFLDFRPVFPGHTLVIPKQHFETMERMPDGFIGPFFKEVKLVSRGIEKAMKADGVFIAMNNKVSQSVPHLHVHIIPRKFHDGMHGFFWPRRAYKDKEELEGIKNQITAAINALTR